MITDLKNVLVFSFTLIFVITFSTPLTAGEVYIWKDKNGVENITTTPPPENAKIRHQEKFRQTDRQEIQAYQQQKKAEADRRDMEDQAKRRAFEYEQITKDISKNYEVGKRKREIKWAKEAYDREQETLEKYQDHRRSSRTNYGQRLWNDSIRDQEKEVEKARRKLYDLERQ